MKMIKNYKLYNKPYISTAIYLLLLEKNKKKGLDVLLLL